MRNILVVTTINNESHKGLIKLIQNTNAQDYELIIIGDQKTHLNLDTFKQYRVSYWNIEKQLNSQFISGNLLPVNHYARKNFGYLVAAQLGAEWISETDDDNLLFDEFWNFQESNYRISNFNDEKWINIYSHFGHSEIWHRGIPINKLHNSNNTQKETLNKVGELVCIQGLANGDPDIDAICRIIYKPHVEFLTDKSFLIGTQEYCPTNSQLTRWKTRFTLPLLYLPSTVPWRVSDIWRGLIAQRFFSINGFETQFRGGIGYQDRNQHDLLKDFIDEYPVHTMTDKLISILESVDIENPYEYMEFVYRKLIGIKLIEEDELNMLLGWIEDVKSILKKGLNRNEP